MPTVDDVVEYELTRCGALVHARIEELVNDSMTSPELRELVLDYPRRGGKALRPALLLAACAAFGGDRETALPSAVAVELLHNAFLVHDDIEDASERRRGRPSLHHQAGLARAIHAGDALAFTAFAPVIASERVGSRVSGLVLKELMAMTNATLHGQDRELRWRADGPMQLTLADYVALVGQKTAAYTTVHPLRIGAVIATQGTADLQELTAYGFYLGVAFQIRDDVLDLDERNTAKEPYSDLREGKRTLLLSHVASTMTGAEQTWLEAYFATDPEHREESDVRRLARLMRERGSVAWAMDVAASIAEMAHAAFERTFRHLPPTDAAAFLRATTEYMTARPR